MTRLQKKILIFLVVLSIITPAGILLPKYLNSSGAFCELPADSLKKNIGYAPEGIKKSEENKAPVSGYSLNLKDKSDVHQALYYIISGITGTILTLVITFIISKKILKNEK